MANTRRPQGDGTIRKREDGRWEGRIIIGHKNNGTPIFKSAFGKTQKSALKALHQLIDLYRDVDLTEDCRMTLGEWMDKWLDEYVLFSVRENTVSSYRRLSDNYIKPYLGEKQLAYLTTTDMQKFYNKVKKKGRVTEHPRYGHTLSNSTVRHIHMILHQAFEVAVKERLVVRNPTIGTTIPKKTYGEKQILDDDQLDRFMTVIKEMPFWNDFFYVEIMTGLRRGEICGLKWSDMNFDEGTLFVQRAVSITKKRCIIGETKTGTGTRKILLPPSVTERLKKRQKDAISEWVFPHFNNPAEPIHPDTAYRTLKSILRHAELPAIRFHDLRHTFATHAMQSGVDAKTLASLLGHTNASFTLDTYTHVTYDMQNNASAVVNSMMQQFLQTGGTDG